MAVEGRYRGAEREEVVGYNFFFWGRRTLAGRRRRRRDANRITYTGGRRGVCFGPRARRRLTNTCGRLRRACSGPGAGGPDAPGALAGLRCPRLCGDAPRLRRAGGMTSAASSAELAPPHRRPAEAGHRPAHAFPSGADTHASSAGVSVSSPAPVAENECSPSPGCAGVCSGACVYSSAARAARRPLPLSGRGRARLFSVALSFFTFFC